MSRKTSQITLRGLDETLTKTIHGMAEREDISLNKAMVRLLRRGAGIAEQGPRARIGHSLDRFIGTWSHKDANDFLRGIRAVEKIDDEFWK